MPADRRIHIVEDPDDSRQLAQLMDGAASRVAGRAVMHPTPGLSTSRQLAAGVLVSVGKRFDALQSERAGPRAWSLVDVWITAEHVRHLFDLRAHLLGPKPWQELLELGPRLNVEMWFVVHPRTPAGIHRCLANTAFRRWDPATFTAHWRDSTADDDATSRGSDFLEIPAEDFVTFRSARRRLLDPAAFGRVDAVFCDSMDRTELALDPWRPRPLQPRPPDLDLADVAAQLQALLVSSSGPW